ncbi:uncharacterized protein LOC136712895 isoform X2 [Amia ocellicauda]|uniref:uncharacterized protein LOC136712895 isoform X2 n=1 Tax=Amia ocellicauda TaxID=2972642 RepID=UPI0034638ED3
MDDFEAFVKKFALQRALDAEAPKQPLQEKMVAFSDVAHPDDFCLWCVCYLQRDHRVDHETPILQAMGKLLTSQIEAMSPSTAGKAITMAAGMMGRDLQATSDILLALGSRFLQDVLAALEILYRTDVQPDLIWLTFLGRLSRANVTSAFGSKTGGKAGRFPKTSAGSQKHQLLPRPSTGSGSSTGSLSVEKCYESI